MEITEQLLTTEQGNLVAITLYRGDEETKASVVIAQALGVPQSYYTNFAQWLCASGYHVVTFDYSGVGKSAQQSMRKCKLDILDWASESCTRVVEHVKQTFNDLPLYWLGHSLGGQILGMLPCTRLIDKAVTIASGSGYWLQNSPPTKRKAWLLWFILAPLLTPMFGYFPGSKLRVVGDLPRNVIRQWRKWCLNPEYAVGIEGDALRQRYAAVTAPITSISFTDDEMMSLNSIRALHRFYLNSPQKLIRLSPTDVHETRVGHFGFFRDKFRETLWQQYLLPELR